MGRLPPLPLPSSQPVDMWSKWREGGGRQTLLLSPPSGIPPLFSSLFLPLFLSFSLEVWAGGLPLLPSLGGPAKGGDKNNATTQKEGDEKKTKKWERVKKRRRGRKNHLEWKKGE